ncbi:hypothetical protein CYMTET_4222 [Cymbomonas tetramitiformis]|uniref:RING-type domain-containing protein n=1 Tax=Cymbomonas tetramitiformis TaxID=36881 RepID=A0AAE0LKC0_9CHLO|nr:hypothetical protein CYMTET_4222 [Cymbomonas tetramitiformis]
MYTDEAIVQAITSVDRAPTVEACYQNMFRVDTGGAHHRRPDGRTLLHMAAEHNLRKVCAALLRAGVSPRTRCNKQCTALHVAAVRADSRVVRLLARSDRATVNSRDNHGNTPLHVAMLRDDPSVARALITHRADVNDRNYEGQTPLHLACFQGNQRVVRCLMCKPAVIATCLDKVGNSVLHYAARCANGVCMELCLLKKGVDGADEVKHLINSRNNFGMTAAHVAAEHANLTTLAILHDYDADLNAKCNCEYTTLDLCVRAAGTYCSTTAGWSNGGDITQDVNSTQTVSVDHILICLKFLFKIGVPTRSSRSTVLHTACLARSASAQVVRALLLMDPSLLNELDADNMSPLLHVARNRYASKEIVRVVAALLDAGADHARRDSNGMDVMLSSVCSGNRALFHMLLKRKAPTFRCDSIAHSGANALHLAAGGHSVALFGDVLRVMHANGKAANATDALEKTCYHYAASTASVAVTEIVLQALPITTMRRVDANGATPLHLAVQSTNDDDTVTQKLILFAAKFDVDARTIVGNSALHMAVSQKNVTRIECLLMLGADVDMQNTNKESPLTLAVRDGDVSTVRALFPMHRRGKAHRTDAEAESPVHVAARSGNVTLLEYLLTARPELTRKLINQSNRETCTPLHVAVGFQQTAAVNMLIKYGADVTLRDRHEDTPAMLADSMQNAVIADMLRAAPPPNRRNRRSNMRPSTRDADSERSQSQQEQYDMESVLNFILGEPQKTRKKPKKRAKSNVAAGVPLVKATLTSDAHKKPTCAICLESVPDTVLMPCFHMHTCGDCTAKLQFCPICKSVIEDRRKVFKD